ncbi:hypothetical protein [Turicibacter bilis]|uniref:Uncharacterized protein n=1 Tax=Turicibacter bilis TaxID=2735723 RepID=A0ABY5JK10_9FIRM|nr:hypothetical protein [Turicibacter bilis]MBS3200297.1 hypothetical protein [Turicibacter bilis]UUF07022.1 hypothetical protein J0J69_05870 [Turicibacter bilis]
MIEALRDEGIISLSECDKNEKEHMKIVVKDSKTNLYYKIEQTEEEIKIELLTACYSYLLSI